MPVTGSDDRQARAAVGADIDGWSAGVAIAVAIAIAIVVSLARARAGTADLWFDDSWVALSTRVPLSTASHMGVSAPGFTFVVRWWLGLVPDSVPWAQSFALLGFVLSPVIIFVAARTATATRWAATTMACLTALSPILLAESARVKQYTWEYAFSAAMVAVAAAVRRDGPTARWTLTAAGLAVVAGIFSGSMLIPGALLFLILAVGIWAEVRRDIDPLPLRTALIRVAWLTVAGAILLVWAAIYLLHPPAALANWWRVRDGFLGSSGSITHTARQAYSMLHTIMAALIFGGGTPLMVFPLAALAWFIWRRWRTVWWLLMAPVFAIVLSASQHYPLGARGVSRIEAWLLPWAAVLLALTFTELGAVPHVRRFVAQLSNPMKTVAVALVAFALVAAAWTKTHHYPTVRARAALDTLTVVKGRGLAYVADEDFPVDLLVTTPIRVVDDNVSTTGWTVELRDGPRVLHLADVALAARELRPACDSTAAIAGASTVDLRKVLPLVGCPVLQERVKAPSAAGTWDGTIILTFGPRQ